MRTGPNSASVVVWAIDEYFFCVYYIPTNVLDTNSCNLRIMRQRGW